ncbi:MAG: PfkB family carbohydrate kinase [Planctomycetota bacterium]|nr:PfkB family carbohydrate kinase [Planctomycetota bacterium]
MPLIVTGTIGIDTVHTPHGNAEAVLGGSATYFAAAASFFAPVRMVAAVGGDFHEGHRTTLTRFPEVCVEGIETRNGSKTFAWGGKYLDDMNVRETLFTELGVLEEHPPLTPEAYRDSRYVFLANTHPGVQMGLLENFPKRAIAVADTMNLWIDIARDELVTLMKQIDGLVLNDEEARLLTGKRNPITAAKHILDMGPTFAVVKKGEHGCVMVHRDGIAALPAYPTETVIDPTGAGDSFAGGMMGHVASRHAQSRFGDEPVSFEILQEGLARGTVIASFTIESFSLDRLAELKDEEVQRRLEEYRKVVAV